MTKEQLHHVVIKYNLLIANYAIFFFKNIATDKDKDIETLFLKGLNIIENIFIIALLYLDNLSDIYNLCEKGYVYFVEFMNQLYLNINKNEEPAFELTMKDAVMFCYKKTIFNNPLFECKIKLQKNSKEALITQFHEYNQIILKLTAIMVRDIYCSKEKNIIAENNAKISDLVKMILEIDNLSLEHLQNLKTLIKKIGDFEINDKNDAQFIHLIQKIIAKRYYEKYNDLDLGEI